MSMAAVIHEKSSPDVLRRERVDVPAPGPGEVRLRNEAVGLNFVDTYHRRGIPHPWPVPPLPVVLGIEGTGRVEEIGPGVTGFAAGDRVAHALPPHGACSQTRVHPAEKLLKVPDALDDLDDRVFAASMLKGLTVQLLVRRTYRVAPGEVVLVHAAAAAPARREPSGRPRAGGAGGEPFPGTRRPKIQARRERAGGRRTGDAGCEPFPVNGRPSIMAIRRLATRVFDGTGTVAGSGSRTRRRLSTTPSMGFASISRLRRHEVRWGFRNGTTQVPAGASRGSHRTSRRRKAAQERHDLVARRPRAPHRRIRRGSCAGRQGVRQPARGGRTSSWIRIRAGSSGRTTVRNDGRDSPCGHAAGIHRTLAMNMKRTGGLRGQLVVSAVTSVVLPLVVSGGIAFFFLSYQLDLIATSFDRSRNTVTDEIAGADLRGQARNAARQLDEFLVERIIEAKAWAGADVVIDAARKAAEFHAAQGLTGTPIAQIEDRFRIRKSLGSFPEATRYLRQQIASSPYFAEVFFTDGNGFNVALTNPTSDFVQSDEDWWQSAWGHTLSVDEVQYDDSAGVWSVDISIRIDDPASVQPLGVMKTVLSIESVQRIADRTAESIPSARVQIATGDGRLIAETSSGHALDRIMNENVNIARQDDATLREVFGAERSGFASDAQWLTGYSRTGGRDAYTAATQRFGGFDWIVILRRPVAGIHDRLSALREIRDALSDWPLLLGISLGVAALLSVVLAVGLAAANAGRLAASLAAIREMAEHTSRGEPANVPEISRPLEVVRLNDAVQGLSRAFLTVLQDHRSRQA